MKQSLRSFLTFNLLLSVGFVALIAVSGNVFFKYRDVKPHLDAQLSLASLNMGAMLNEFNDRHDLEQLQERINHIPSQIKNIHSDSHDLDVVMESALRSVQFHIWDDHGNKLLSSSGAPDVDFTGHDGFHYVTVDGVEWRTFTMPIPDSKKIIVAFQRRDIRIGFERQVIYDSILIIALTFTLLTIAVWLIINRGLQGLDRTADEIGNRDPNNLNPIYIETMPAELEPLISSINDLFTKLKEALERERRFAGDAAHELKTPIAAIKTLSQTILSSTTDTHTKRSAEDIILGVNRANHIIDQLLTLSRAVPDALQSTLTPISLSSIATSIVANLTPSAISSGKNISLQKKTSAKIMATQAAVEIIMRNLIDNSIRYTPEGTAISVKIDEKNDQLSLEIYDNGGGVDKSHIEHLSKRFYRIYGTESNGSGLGLNIVAQMTGLLGGTYIIKNKKLPKGQTGLSVKLIFPKYDPNLEQTA